MNRVAGHLPETTAAAFVVGDLYLDVGQQRVTRAGSDIALPNLSFRLLVALVHAAPNVLSTELLMAQVWPGLVVSPETVNKRVNLLREALGDNTRDPRYITSVRSRGYRLIASVSRSTEEALLSNPRTPLPEGSPRAAELPVLPTAIDAHPPDLPTSRSRLRRWAAMSVFAAGLLIATTVGVRWAKRHQVEGSIRAPAAPATTTAAAEALSRTVAVLPFESISTDPADVSLARGLPEIILNRLSRESGLSVIARNSSFALATKSIDSREIGRRLNSGYLIGGSVQRDTDQLRVAVQLVDTAAGTLIWSAHFDRGLHDIFGIEDEIAEQLAGALSVQRVLRIDPMSPSGRFAEAEFSLDDSGIKVSEQKTLQVLELDPNFVPALQRYGKLRWLIDGKPAEAIQILEHAITLEPNNSLLLHTAMGVYVDLGDEKAARAVVAGMPPGVREVGLLAMHEGDWRRAGLSAYDEAGWTSDSDYCEVWQGEALRDYALKTGELSRAIAFIKLKFYLGDAPAKHLDVCNHGAAVYLSQLLAAAGDADQALALRRAAASWNDANEAKYLGGSRRLRAAVLLLDGKPDAALTELAESFRSGFYVYWWYTLDYDPLWVPLHDDSRFQAIKADVHRYIDAQRSELEALRRNGLVPRRGLSATTG